MADELHALARRGGPLIKLARQKLNGKDCGAVRLGHRARCRIRLRLAEDRGDAALEESLVDALHVVAVDEAKALESLDVEHVFQLALELLCLDVKAGLLLYVDA